MDVYRIVKFLLGVILCVLAYFAPLFVGVTYQLTMYDAGIMVIQFLYVVPLCNYGVRDLYSLSLTLGYVCLPAALGVMYIVTAIRDG